MSAKHCTTIPAHMCPVGCLPTELFLQGSKFRLGPVKQLALLGLPALCDICATVLLNLGLLSLSMSTAQILRGAVPTEMPTSTHSQCSGTEPIILNAPSGRTDTTLYRHSIR